MESYQEAHGQIIKGTLALLLPSNTRQLLVCFQVREAHQESEGGQGGTRRARGAREAHQESEGSPETLQNPENIGYNLPKTISEGQLDYEALWVIEDSIGQPHEAQ